MQQSTAFHDYYKLSEYDFSQKKLIVFTGKSGAGKSTYIQYLIENNRSIYSKPMTVYNSRPMLWKKINNKHDLLIIDELKTVGEVYYIIKLLLRGNRLIVANHVPVMLLSIISLLIPTTLFNLDNPKHKIVHYLTIRGYHYSDTTIEQYCNTFDANYTDLDIILEFAEGKNFDKIYRHFMRFKNILRISE